MGKKKACKRSKTGKAKRKGKKQPELAKYVLHTPILRFKLKKEKVVGLSDSIKEMYDTCH